MSPVGTARRPPRPPGHWLLGHTQAIRADALGTFLDYFSAYGDVVEVRLGPQRSYLVAHPDHVREVLQKRHASYDKRLFSYRRLRTLIGEGLVTSDGPLWQQERRLAQPAFHRARIARLDRTAVPAAERVAIRWRAAAERGEPIDVQADMMRAALEVAAEALFGCTLEATSKRFSDAMGTALRETIVRMYALFPLPEFLPTPANRRLSRAKAEVAKAVDEIIRTGHRSGSGDDLLGALRAGGDGGLEPRHVRDVVTTLLLAGHETTANALSWTWYLLARHPEAAARLRTELTSVLGGRAPDAADLPRLVYTRMVIEESMRLLPPVWALDRRAVVEDVLGGYRIRAGGMIILSPYVTHRHPEFWPEPERFDPERFRPEAAARRHPFAYFPFAAGPRGCMGQHFAMVEAILILATLAQRFDPALVPGQWPVAEASVTLRPRDGLAMTVRALAPRASADAMA